MHRMRHGVRIAVDPGAVRVGVARSDPAGMLAVPLLTLKRGAGDLTAIAELVREYEAIEVLVGHPINLRGEAGPAAAAALAYADELVPLVAPADVRLVDERLSTKAAQRQISEVGRKKGRARSVIDQAAAVNILQHALDAELATGNPAGTTVRTP